MAKNKKKDNVFSQVNKAQEVLNKIKALLDDNGLAIKIEHTIKIIKKKED
jgi:hypothetical protein